MKKLLFCHDTYYAKTPDGKILSYGAFPYALWAERFLPHFDEITVIGRAHEFEPKSQKLDISSGANVKFKLLPNINTPLKRLFCSGKNSQDIEREVINSDAVIIRGPVEFGMMAAKLARKHDKPYAVEMSGCAFDHTWYHGSLIGKLYAPLKYMRAKSMVKHADAVIYVTQDFLQSRYPTNGFTSYASNVEIAPTSDAVLAQRLKKLGSAPEKFIIGLIGNVNNNLKGLDIALQSLATIKDSIPDFELRLLGQGDENKWQSRIKKYGLDGKIIFSGTLPGGEQVLNWLDEIDLYIQPSFHEGLPRALIEAMSRGCPALASDAGGTAELLKPEDIHRRGNVQQFAQRLDEVINDQNYLQNQARRNFEIAKRYTSEQLIPRRREFWNCFAALT